MGHESAIIWPVFRAKGTEGRTYEQAPLEGMGGFTLHRMQGGKEGDYHSHEDAEQVYYFIAGCGKMKIDCPPCPHAVKPFTSGTTHQ